MPMTDLPNTPGSYAAVLRERWWLVAATTIVCIAAAFLLLHLTPHRYTASADLQATPISSADDDFMGIPVLRDSVVSPSSNVLTVARIVDQRATAALAQKRLHSSLSIEELQADVVVSPVSQTSIVSISATAGSPTAAAAIANAFADATVSRRNAAFQQALVPTVSGLRSQATRLAGGKGTSAESAAVQARLAVLQPLVGSGDPTVSLLDSASAPTGPSSPKSSLTLLAALAGGLFLGVVFALARGLTPSRLRRDDDVEAATGGVPILARIPAAADSAAFAFRHLCARLMPPEGAPAAILVASAERGDGSAAVATGIARGLAQSGSRVLLVDCDVTDSMLVTTLGPESGFSTGLLASGLAARPLFKLGERLALLKSAPPSPGELERLDVPTVRTAIAQLKQKADVVVIDGGSVADSLGAVTLAEAIDATVLTVRPGSTNRGRVVHLAELLADADVRPVGTVLVETAHRRPSGRSLRALFARTTSGAAATANRAPAGAEGSSTRSSSDAVLALARSIDERPKQPSTQVRTAPAVKSSAASRAAERGAGS